MPTWQRKINVRQRLCVPRVSKHPASNKCTIVCGVRGQESSQDQSLFQSWYTVDRKSLSPSRFRWESSRGDCDKKWLVRMLPPPAMEPPLLFYLKQNCRFIFRWRWKVYEYPWRRNKQTWRWTTRNAATPALKRSGTSQKAFLGSLTSITQVIYNASSLSW